MTRASARRARPFLLLLLLLALVPGAVAAQSGNDLTAIQATRAASNAALASGDLAGFMASIDADYVGTAGSGGHIRSRDGLRQRIAGVFRDTPGLHFVRTPESIVLAEGGQRAMETGQWVTVIPQAARDAPAAAGRYTAYWRVVDGAWVIHAEVFVTLESP